MEMTINMPPPTKAENIRFTPDGDLFKNMGMKELPFKAYFSMMPLIKMIEKRAQKNHPSDGFLARAILKKLEKVPEWREPIKDISSIKENMDIAEMMMLFLIPPGGRHKRLAKISPPSLWSRFILLLRSWK